MLSNEYFMFIQGPYIYTLNLLNGEKKIYDLYNYDIFPRYDMVIMDYCLIDELIYATDSIHLYIVNMDNGYIEKYKVDHSIDYSMYDFGLEISEFSIYNLYTDGNKIYGLIYIKDDDTMELAELFITENQDTETKDKDPFIVKKRSLANEKNILN